MIRIQTEDFDIGTEIEKIRAAHKNIGALISFTGLVRADKPSPDTPSELAAEITGEITAQVTAQVTAMTLEHFPGMSEKELARIEAEANQRWPLQASLIIHRTGTLKPGDNIVLVITASAHRAAAFESASFLMDYLKNDAPFWKKHHLSDGTDHWVEAKESDQAAQKRWQE